MSQDIEKIHSIERLLESCAAVEPAFVELQEHAARLSAFYIETRYPGDFPQFTLADAEHALQSAQSIKQFALEHLR